MADITGWRSMQLEDQEQFHTWLYTNLKQRWYLGKEKYQLDIHGFQGNPLDHLIEELLNALLYAYWERRRQNEES